MELIAWAAYVLALVGPYILVVIAVCVAVFIVTRLAFKANRQLGYSVVGLICIGASWLAYKYLWLGPSAFRVACDSGTGLAVVKKVNAESYVLMATPEFGAGYLNGTDATIRQAILNVARKKVLFVEIQDWNDPANEYGVPGILAEFRPPSAPRGYFKLSIARRNSENCRWVMPDEVGSLDAYESYISFGLNHKLNELLQAKGEGKGCVAVDYVASPSSPYFVEFIIGDKLDDRVLRHEIRVVHRDGNESTLGRIVAYEHRASGVWDSTAFWLGSGRQHSTCPVNLLEGNVVRETLGISF